MALHAFDTRVAAYGVIVDENDRILLALWNGEGHAAPGWTLPGGGVELDESVAEAAVRELREETGYDVELGPILGIDCLTIPVERRFHGDTRPLKGVRIVYEARIVGGVLTNEVGGSTTEARWVPFGDVAALDRVDLVDSGIALWRQR